MSKRDEFRDGRVLPVELDGEGVEAEEVLVEGVSPKVIGSLRSILGEDAAMVEDAFRDALTDSNVKIRLDAARAVADLARHATEGQRVVGTLPRSPQEVEKLTFAETEAALFVMLAAEAGAILDREGDIERAAEVFRARLDPEGTRYALLRRALASV